LRNLNPTFPDSELPTALLLSIFLTKADGAHGATWSAPHSLVAVEGSEEFWRELDELSWKVIRRWQAEEIQQWSIEDDDPEEIYIEGITMVNREIREWSRKYWQDHENCHQIPEERFGDDSVMLWGQNFDGRVHHVVKEYQGQWTERRQITLMEELEEMDKLKKTRGAENRWEYTLGKREFQAIRKSVMKEKAREIRASHMGTEEIANAAMTLWVHTHYIVYGQAEKRRTIGDHLDLYEDFKAAI
jgi:hypothetical protein